MVRVIAPGSAFDPAWFEAGLAVLRDRLGLRPRFRDDITAREGYLAGGDARRLAEWDEAVADPEATAIFCARGGYGAMRLLPAIDPAPLLRNPKWLVQAGLLGNESPTVAFIEARLSNAHVLFYGVLVVVVVLFAPDGFLGLLRNATAWVKKRLAARRGPPGESAGAA